MLSAVDRGRHPDAATIEHLCPRARGGEWVIDNLALAHGHCNGARSAAGDCVAALVCAVDVLGPDASIGEIAKWFPIRPAVMSAEWEAIARRLAQQRKDFGLRRGFTTFDAWPELWEGLEARRLAVRA